MIYTRFGTEVKIIERHGSHKPKWGVSKVPLVTVVAVAGGKKYYKYSINLKADNGLSEINEALDKATEVVLTKRVLKLAKEEAT